MSKHPNTRLLILISFIIVAGAGLYIFRNPLLETFIHNQLRKQGIPVQSISVVDVSLNTLHLRDLIVGAGKELRIGKILVNWDLMDLLTGKLASVEMTGLRMVLDLSGEHAPLGSLQPMISSSGEEAGSLPWLPAFSLRDSTLHLHSAAGDFAVVLSGDVDQGRSGTQTIQLSAAISDPSGHARGVLAATLDGQGNVRGRITVAEGMVNLPGAKISGFSGEATFVLAAMRLQHIRTEFVLSGMKLSGKNLVEPVSGQAGNSVSAIAPHDAIVDQITFKGDIHGSPDSWAGTLDLDIEGGQLTAGPLNIQQALVSLPMQVNFAGDVGRLGLRNPAQITLEKIDASDALKFRGPVGFSISQADFEWVKNPQGWVLKHYTAVTPTDFMVLIKQGKPPAIETQIHPGKVTAQGSLDTDHKYQGQVAIKDTAFFLPQSRLQLKHISANLHLGATETDKVADFTIGQLQHVAHKPFFETHAFSGSIKNPFIDGKPTAYLLDLAGGVLGLRYLKLTGKHVPDSGDGSLAIEISPLRFSPGGLQPGVLSPVFAQLEDVSGLVHANAQFKWSRKGILSSRGTVDLKELSFAHEIVRIRNLSAALSLNDLLSPSSPSRQTITARSIDPGVPMENLLISYRIESADQPRVMLEKAQFSMFGGELTLEPTVIDPVAAHSDIMVHVNHIDLATFFNLIQVDGLTGNGHLDGHIPMTLTGDQVTIKDSRLVATAPGILHFKSEKASQLLANAGEEMNLLLQTLQDFHYTELSLTMNKSASHDLTARLSLLGSNPDIKDGQVFRLNITLESNIDKILSAITQGYSLSNEILRNTFKLH
ncbi:MAG: YdbH domain-containing protein [Pseudomonadota bacterium]